jgi:exopolysaccharide production protein ExoY
MGAAAQRLVAARAGILRPYPSVAWRLWMAGGRLAAAGSVAMTAPLLIGIGALIRVLSGRTPLVAHRRIGMDGQLFRMLKFRTMWSDECDSGERAGCCGLVAYLEAPEHAVPARKDGSDPRVTSSVARFLRRHSFDELPQLLHVAAGTMAWVGPRPMLAAELAEHYGEDGAEVLRVPPGLTGLWQVMGRDRLGYRQRRRLDLFLVRRRSIGLHLRILVRTVPQVISGANSC